MGTLIGGFGAVLGMNHHPQGCRGLFGPRHYQANIIIPCGGGWRWPIIAGSAKRWLRWNLHF